MFNKWTVIANKHNLHHRSVRMKPLIAYMRKNEENTGGSCSIDDIGETIST